MIWIAAGASWLLTCALLLRALQLGCRHEELLYERGRWREAVAMEARARSCIHLATISGLLTLLLGVLGFLS
jgi:hypothetical protein